MNEKTKEQETESRPEDAQASEQVKAVVRCWRLVVYKFMQHFSHIKILEFNFGGRFDLQLLQFGYKASWCFIDIHYGTIKDKKYLHGYLFYGIIPIDKYWR